jgi:hypothetical protein
MTCKKCLLLALAIVVPLTLVLWLTFSPLLSYALYPGLKVQTLITAITANSQGALLGLACGAAVNALLYSLAIFALTNLWQAIKRRGSNYPIV